MASGRFYASRHPRAVQALQTQGTKLLLEVQGSSNTRAVLKFDGTRFVQLN